MSIPGAASPLFLGAAAVEAGPFQIDRSLRFNSADSSYLTFQPPSAGNRKTWTWSAWVKRGGLGSTQGRIFGGGVTSTDYFELYFPSGNELRVIWYEGGQTFTTTTAVFRDPSAWYHIVLAVDTTQSTASDRIKIYVNGSLQDRSSTNPSQNFETSVNKAVEHNIGRYLTGSGSSYFDGYLADVYLIDGQALAPTDFAETDSDNNWNPKAYTGSYGTNGFHLDFSDNTSTTTIAEDSSGNNNDFTANNLSVASGAGNDSLIDTPTNYEAGSGNNGGNYCTWNPLKQTSGTYSDGNLQIATSSGNKHYQATFGLTSGKWYWEVTPTTGSTPGMIGIALDSKPLSNNLNGDSAMSYYSVTGNKQGGNTSGVDTSYGASYTYNDVIGVALDLDSATKTITFYKNGSSQGVAFNPDPTLGSWHPAVSAGSSSNTTTFVANFGQRPFAYTPPTGYLSLCTQNLTDPTIADGSTAMDVKTYSGTGSTNAITGFNFSPDLVWLKRRDGANGHVWFDQIRGVTKALESSSNTAEKTNDPAIASFDASGFTVNGTYSQTNSSGALYVGWIWDAGTSTVSNTDGSITSNVRANASAGFSIVSYTGNATQGATIGHGLNAVPEFMIVKSRDYTSYGVAYHKYIDATAPEDYFVRLFASETDGVKVRTNSSGAWFDTAPTSSVFTVSNALVTNGSSFNYIAYIWAPVAGYSAFGSYTGNGSADGPFIHTGFRPAVILTKASSAAGTWIIRDTARDTFNSGTSAKLAPNYSYEENNSSFIGLASQTLADFLSNGFKVRSTGGISNDSGVTYIWAAFAEHPFKTARAR